MTREDARKILETKRSIIATLGGADDWVEALDTGIKALSVPEREKGEWTYDGDCIHCSSCKSAFNNLIGFNFCPNCGADMRE